MFLHARRLALRHPLTGEAMVLVAPLPDELRAYLAQLGAPDTGSVTGLDEGPPEAGDGEARSPGVGGRTGREERSRGPDRTRGANRRAAVTGATTGKPRP
jgi:hypothetical protein